MYVARVLYPVEVLGPGKRVGIWFCGCPRRCKGCSNPELWTFQERYRTSPQVVYELVLRIAAEHTIDGFTITGGDPMYQEAELQELLGLLRGISDDILVYTGYSIGELSRAALSGISVLIDGAYIESRNTGCALRGSDNQGIHILDPDYREKYAAYLNQHRNAIQNFMTADGVISVGIHRPNFMTELKAGLRRKGLNDNG